MMPNHALHGAPDLKTLKHNPEFQALLCQLKPQGMNTGAGAPPFVRPGLTFSVMRGFFLATCLSVAAFAQPTRVILSEEFLGGAENAKMILSAEIVSIEKVSVPKAVKNLRWKNGQLEYDEVELIFWKGGALTVDEGPVPIPAVLVTKLRELLRTPVFDNGLRGACGYLPTHRIRLKKEGHSLEILIIDCYESFDVYLDGEKIGGRWPFGDRRESHEIIRTLDALLRK